MTMISNDIGIDGTKRISETAWLLGQPSLGSYLHFVREQTIGGRNLKRSDLVDGWRKANDYYYELEQDEAGIADTVDIRDIAPAARHVVDEITSSARFQRAFDAVPTHLAMVELDRMIVSQQHIDITHSARQQARLGTGADEATLLRFCQGLDREDAPVKVQRIGRSRFMFSSESSDFRFHEAMVLQPDVLQGISALRDGSTVLGLQVGYSSNFLNVIRSENRVALFNGHHRAYMLRALGYTHAPCVVQTVTRRDELNLIASGDLVESPAHYFKAARPPLLKDFFDSRIRKTFYLPRILRTVELSFEVREFEVAD